MNELASFDSYGVLTEPATLNIRRLLPGPIERVWAYLTESELRRQWLAAAQMEMKVGAPLEFVWRNDELIAPRRPPLRTPRRAGCARRNSRKPRPSARGAGSFRALAHKHYRFRGLAP